MIFGLAHGGQGTVGIVVIIGLFLGWPYLKSGSRLPPMVARRF
ncbi:MAG: CPBP family glutamic-type intramembrane protease [Bacteroidota bacterium]